MQSGNYNYGKKTLVTDPLSFPVCICMSTGAAPVQNAGPSPQATHPPH